MNVNAIRGAEYVKHTSNNKEKVTNKGRNFRSDLVECRLPFKNRRQRQV